MNKITEIILGKPKNFFRHGAKDNIALVAFLAWIGLGSDGLSSANYGPQEAFMALGHYPMLGLFLAIMIAVSVFIISSAYNQVIELFPTGGGGYKVSNMLVSPMAGLISGVALVIDYILTIAISVSAASDALFSLLPLNYQPFNLYCKLFLVVVLTVLNLRGMKESIKIMMPIFLGFVITHLALLLYGFIAHFDRLSFVASGALQETHQLHHSVGLFAVLLILFKAYSLGGGTYTGLEAVSNNVDVLKEPRVKTGKWTMLYMALSLSITAGGITLLYMIWHVKGIPGQTYNAILFSKMLGQTVWGHIALIITLAFEVGILFLGANTGFLGGPAVLANMSSDQWVPAYFGNLSSRLVKQNGIIFFGVCALVVIALFDGHVSILVVLYSTSVFLTFSLSLFGLVKYWSTDGRKNKKKYKVSAWASKLFISFIGLIICVAILLITTIEKFDSGGWLTLVVIGLFIYAALYIRQYYIKVNKLMSRAEQGLTHFSTRQKSKTPPAVNPEKPTAVILLSEHRAMGIHTLLNIQRLFPNRFFNFIFLHTGVVDVKCFRGEDEFKQLKKSTEADIQFFLEYARKIGLACDGQSAFGTSAVQVTVDQINDIKQTYKDAMFFATRLIVRKRPLTTRFLDDGVASTIQNRLHFEGHHLIVLPMRVNY